MIRFPEKLHLTVTEKLVISQVMTGADYKAMAGILAVSEKTVRTHITNILDKTGMGNSRELMAYFHKIEIEALRTRCVKLTARIKQLGQMLEGDTF